ncbi:hypothetical protein GF366_02030 [Candidatus Peregrinibacteria bacterium]|nr:hypothetical protein [Candidatus Peregrinibacteria bacterium]
MDYKKIIADSWSFTQKNKKLIIWFGFIPSLFTTTVGVGYFAYQFFAFKQSYLFSDVDKSFLHDVATFIWTFIQQHVSWTVPLIIAAVLFGIIYFLFPTLAKASAIQSIARNRNGQKAGVGAGFRYGIMSFLPLFEYHLLIKTFAFFSILIEMSFVLRNLGPVIFKLFMPVFIILIILSLILTLLFTYTDFFIVIDGCKVFESMKKSAKLVVVHLKHTFLITILMLIIGIRIVIQAILVFLIPALIVLITGYIAAVALPVTGVIVGGIVGFLALLIAAYLNGIVDIFSYTVWTFTFLELTSEKEITARDVFKDEIAEKKQHDYKGHKNL